MSEEENGPPSIEQSLDFIHDKLADIAMSLEELVGILRDLTGETSHSTTSRTFLRTLDIGRDS